MAKRAKRVGRLHTLAAVRTELGRLYRDGRTGKTDPGDVAKLAPTLKVIMECIKSDEVEKRLELLEAMASEQPKSVVMPQPIFSVRPYPDRSALS